MKLLATPIGYLLSLIYNVVDNYGFSIIILTLLIRLLMLPLYGKQIKYSARMAELQPKLQEIQTRYAHDKETMNQKTMELYQKEGVSPTSGCLPLLIQMPIIFGLYALLRDPLSFINTAKMIVAVHESFFWIPDLSQSDAWILPILAGITTFFTQAQTSSNDTTGMMSGMKYFFPVMIFALAKSFPAGLALYWAIGNVFQMGQTFFLNKKNKEMKFKREAEEEVRKNMKKNK